MAPMPRQIRIRVRHFVRFFDYLVDISGKLSIVNPHSANYEKTKVITV